MRTSLKTFSLVLLALCFFISCKESTTIEPVSPNQLSSDEQIIDHLPSWNDSEAKKNIIAYVEDVTDRNSVNYVEVQDRIATFDNDGTLWSEQPAYFQLFFALDRIKAMAGERPATVGTN